MAPKPLTNKDTDRMLERNTADSDIVKAVLKKLDRRAKLKELAKEIFQGIQSTPSVEPPNEEMLAGELERGTMCVLDPIRFDCAVDDFDCIKDLGVGGFDCLGGKELYGDCGKTKYSFDCSDTYDCDVVAFDCWSYTCSDSKAYTCAETVDFLCGDNFKCVDKTNFTCSAGHGFFCTDDHDCDTNFTCAGTGKTECGKNYPYNPFGDESDTTPGDFYCGHPANDPDVFDCSVNFECSAADDYGCVTSTDFDCGSSKTTSQFDCLNDFDCGDTEADDFDCLDTFNCGVGSSKGDFDCVDQTGGYDCPDKFFCNEEYKCHSGSGNFDCDAIFACTVGFDCLDEFECISNFSCYNTHDCKSIFGCTTADYDCIDSHECSGQYDSDK